MDVSVILPVINETYSLYKTVEVIQESSSKYIKEYIIVICKFTSKESLNVIETLGKDFPNLIRVHKQKLPYLGGALREAFELVKGSHLILMASDLETDPDLVSLFISEELKMKNGIVTASRWIRGGSFLGYSKMKLVLNFLFQKLLSIIYFSKLTDMTYAYRIMPTKLMQNIKWEELRHPFLLETLLKPLVLGIKIKEIPAKWEARSEGESQNTLIRTFEYLRIAFKTRLYRKDDILRNK